jgi:hypothetical protein
MRERVNPNIKRFTLEARCHRRFFNVEIYTTCIRSNYVGLGQCNSK